MNNREIVLQLVKVAGFHNDTREGTRLFIQNKLSKKAYEAAFNAGREEKKNGGKCSCKQCAVKYWKNLNFKKCGETTNIKFAESESAPTSGEWVECEKEELKSCTHLFTQASVRYYGYL